MNLVVGALIDVKDSVGIWSEAEVQKIDSSSSRIYVTYLYWSTHFNEWIDDVDRVAKINTHTYYEGGPFKAGQRIEALDQTNKWLEAFVIEVDDYRVKVHYKGWSSKFDEWHDSQNPSKLRRYGINKPRTNTKETKLFKIPGVELVTISGIGFDMKNDSSDKVSIKAADYNTNKNDDNNDDAADSKSPKYKNANLQNRTRQISESSDRYAQYITALKFQNLRVVAISGDGNCLFRSVAHQVYGDEEFHGVVRQKCMDYMEA
jgi:OTU domain-containing protein 5